MAEKTQGPGHGSEKQPGLLAQLGRWVGLRPGQADLLRYLLIMAVIGFMLMTFGGFLGRPGPVPAVPGREVAARSTQPSDRAGAPEGLFSYEQVLADELRRVLAQVDGAGRVDVTVSLGTGPTRVVATDSRTNSRRTEERDSGGGTRVINETDESGQMVILRTGGGPDQPLVLREERAQIAGVLVVADGARDARVRERLTRAAAVALGVSTHRIQVVPRAGD